MSRWFRFYDDAINDPKILKLSDKLFRFWTGVLCVASKNNGMLPSNEDMALLLRMKSDKVTELFKELMTAGLIDTDETGDHPHNWNGRQFKSDVSTERVKRFRNAQHAVSETLPETEQIQNRTEKKPKKVSVYIDAADVPENPTEEAKAFALGKEWDETKTAHEWQRFRDHGIQKGRKHKGPLGLAAAWRNWVTSPFQKTQENGNAQATQRQSGGAFGASKDRFRDAFTELKAFNAEQRSSRGDGTVIELLPAAGRERS